MRADINGSTDGRKIIRVLFERITPEADAPTIEVVFKITFPEDFSISADHIRFLSLLSSTRTDTR